MGLAIGEGLRSHMEARRYYPCPTSTDPDACEKVMSYRELIAEEARKLGSQQDRWAVAYRGLNGRQSCGLQAGKRGRYCGIECGTKSAAEQPRW